MIVINRESSATNVEGCGKCYVIRVVNEDGDAEYYPYKKYSLNVTFASYYTYVVTKLVNHYEKLGYHSSEKAQYLFLQKKSNSLVLSTPKSISMGKQKVPKFLKLDFSSGKYD
jgi:hypothetical protein